MHGGESRWREPPVARVLALAFADAPAASDEVVGREVAEAAERLGLAERIAERFPSAAPEEWRERLRQEASRGMVLEAAVERLAEAAAAESVPAILLKGMALVRSGVTRPGRRPMGDVDALVGPEGAERLTGRLSGVGFEQLQRSEGDYHHHRPPLTDPTLGTIELHTRLPGVRLAGRSATADALTSTGLVLPDPGGSTLSLPPPQVLAAHGIAHVLYQERYLGVGIGFFRMLGDLVDLEHGGSLRNAVEEAVPFLDRSVPPDELTASRDLLSSLRNGELPGKPRARRLLDHYVTASFHQAATRKRLRWKRWLHVLRMEGGWGRLVDRLRG